MSKQIVNPAPIINRKIAALGLMPVPTVVTISVPYIAQATANYSKTPGFPVIVRPGEIWSVDLLVVMREHLDGIKIRWSADEGTDIFWTKDTPETETNYRNQVKSEFIYAHPSPLPFNVTQVSIRLSAIFVPLFLTGQRSVTLDIGRENITSPSRDNWQIETMRMISRRLS